MCNTWMRPSALKGRCPTYVRICCDMSVSKPFPQCSLSDLAHAIVEESSVTSASALDAATTDRLLPPLRSAALTQAVLLRHPLVHDGSGLKCDASALSKRAWCSMLRDLFDAAGVDVSDAALLQVYIVCKQCAQRGRVQVSEALPLTAFEYDDPFLGRRVRVCVAQLRQVDAPLQLMQLLLRLQLPRGRSSRADVLRPSPPLCHMQAALWPAQRARAMPGFTALLSRRLSTAPASLKVYFRSAAGWKAFIFSRVISGHVSRLQVLLLPCEMARCLCLLTRAAALSGSMRADLAWRRQQLRHAPAPRLLTPPVFRRRLLLLASSASAASSKRPKTATLLSCLIMLWPIPLALA